MPQNPTQVLARFAATLEYERIPVHTREYCKNLLLDTLACAVAGHQGEETNQVAALASALGQSDESSVLGGDRLSLAGATLLNGYLVTAVTMCDIHRSTLTHVTPEVMPPALAVAERDGLSGRDLLVSLAAGCEITTRVGLGLDYPEFRRRGWHGPGIIGPFGGAAAVGRLIGLDTETMSKAFALAGSQAAGTFAAWGTPTVKFHQCRGALSGLMAALLAQQKFEATQEFLTAADGGLYNTYTNGGKPEAATSGLGERWELEQIALRLWPSASTIQGLITAMFDLIEQHQVRAEQIRKLRVSLGETANKMHGIFPHYKAKFEALLSTHYAAAVILHDRELTLAQFEPERYNDPKVKSFAAEKVEVREDKSLQGVQAVVQAETVDGRTIEVRCDTPRGSPENPLTRGQIEAKFRTYAKPRISTGRIEEVINIVSKLEDLPNVRNLMNLLRFTNDARGKAAAAA
ncbi:MAG TPA: MmgE/PrpD family protein [Burkholderiales bacterium]|nr:MmgE/PrpD family protein [Burkholderiales bacterium]